jgi:transposase
MLLEISSDKVEVMVTKLRAREHLASDESGNAAELIHTMWYMIGRLRQYDINIRQMQRLLGIPGRKPGKGDKESSTGVRGGSPKTEPKTPTENSEASSPPAPSDLAADPPSDDADKSSSRRNHGRRGWNDFSEFPVSYHAHTELTVGCECPRCQRGRLYPFEPARFASIIGRAPLEGGRHEAEQLQCNQCNVVFRAPLGDHLEQDGVSGKRLYSYSAASVICIYKSFGGQPWFRQETLQVALGGVKVPDASMSDLTERVANAAVPVARYLRAFACDARLFLGDDTSAQILELKSITRAERRTGKLVERTGCHVSCVIAITSEGHRIVIFRVGIQHTGELLDEILEGRDPQLPVPLVMGDCHACNTVATCRVIYGGCNAHAVRRFKDVKDRYPQEAGYALERYKKIFAHEDHCKLVGLDDDQRLGYHREHSKPLFDEICEHGETLLEDKQIEPHSDIGEAYGYMTNNRVRLSAFLRHPGMPIENNDPERTLRVPVRLRDNAPFFKNSIGGAWAETIWTVGETALACGVNLLDYFNGLQRYAEDVRRNPHLWVPWAFHERLSFLQETAVNVPRPSDHGEPLGHGTLVNPPGANTQPAPYESNLRQPAKRATDVGQPRPPPRPVRPANIEIAPC